jgi:hypothetical protein
VTPLVSGGQTDADNLALACVSCSLRKGAKESATDPKTKKVCRIFNPRNDTWEKHFEWQGFNVKGRTPTGRATIETLKLNRKIIIAIRNEEDLLGRFS